LSFILDALRKAEQERSLGRAPDLQTIHTLPEPARRRFWPWLVSGVLLFNAVILMYLFTGFHPTDEPRVESLAATGPAASQPGETEPVINRTLNRERHPDATPVVPVEALEPKLTTPKLTTNESLMPITSPTLTSDDSSWSPLEMPGADTTALLPQTDLLPDAQDVSISPRTVEFAEQPLQTDLQVPPLRAMPAGFRSTLPELNLDVHVYSEHPQRRFVLINSRRYQQGEQLSEGPLLETITEDGVVLSFLDQRFSLNVQR
jgi:general secretion pathway protein B